MTRNTNYENFKSEDFISDDSFVAWFYKTDNEAIVFWDDWIIRHPGKQVDIKEAVELLAFIQAGSEAPQNQQVTMAEKRLMNAIEEYETQKAELNKRGRKRSVFYWSAAASVLLLLSSLTGYFFFDRQEVYKTAYGETREIILPDSSVVSLNANSSLRLSDNWKTNRQVWLEGEAFFEVKHTRNNSRFLVHTEDVNIEVLGTQFNVFKRANRTQVVLSSGKIKLTRQEDKSVLILEPGDLVELTKTKPQTIKKQVVSEAYTSWKEDSVVFNKKPLSEIAEMITNNYGYKVIVAHAELNEIPFTYTWVDHDLELLLSALSEALNVDIRKENGTIIFTKKNKN